MGIVAEWVLIIAVIMTIATQVLIPAYHNRPLFPLFRRESKLKSKLVSLEQEEHELQLEKVVEAKEATLHPVVEVPAVEVNQETPQ